MTTDQQKAYDIGYKTFTTGVTATGKIKIDQTAFTTNNYQTFGNDFALASSLYSYYVNGYNQAEADNVSKAGMSILTSVLIIGAGLGILFFFRKKK